MKHLLTRRYNLNDIFFTFSNEFRWSLQQFWPLALGQPYTVTFFSCMYRSWMSEKLHAPGTPSGSFKISRSRFSHKMCVLLRDGPVEWCSFQSYVQSQGSDERKSKEILIYFEQTFLYLHLTKSSQNKFLQFSSIWNFVIIVVYFWLKSVILNIWNQLF